MAIEDSEESILPFQSLPFDKLRAGFAQGKLAQGSA
jgi:hypothetical protein